MPKGNEPVVTGATPARAVKRWDTWRERDRQAFLDLLATTGNVSHAARSIGRTSQAVHALRRRDVGFAAAWREAMDTACETLQAAVIQHALGDGAQPDVQPEPCPTCGGQGGRAFDPELALRVLGNRATRLAKPIQASPSSHRPMSIEQVEASLNRKIDGIIRARTKASRDKTGRTGTAA